MASVLEVSHLTKRFGPPVGGFTAVDDISFSVKEGEIVGLLGPNGAGKTTTIQMMLGLTTPTAGTIHYFGKDFKKHRSESAQYVNFASGYLRLPWQMTVWENLDVYARLYGVKNREKRIEDVLMAFDSIQYKDTEVRSLSTGQLMRIILAKAMLNYPRVLLLDEPTAFLDPEIAQKVRAFLLNQQEVYKVAMLFTSHNMAEVEEVCDRVIFLSHGKIIAEDTPQGLAKRNTQSELRLMIIDGLKRLVAEAQERHYLIMEERRFVQVNLPEKDIGEFLSTLGKIGVEYSEIEINRPTLEDFFLSVVKQKGGKFND